MHRIDAGKSNATELGESPFSISTDFVKEEEVCSRRELFSLWKKESKSLTREMSPAKWRFNHHALNVRQYYTDFQFTNITVDIDKCTLCQVCVRICDQKCFDIQDEHFSLFRKGMYFLWFMCRYLSREGNHIGGKNHQDKRDKPTYL